MHGDIWDWTTDTGNWLLGLPGDILGGATNAMSNLMMPMVVGIVGIVAVVVML